MWAKTEVSQKVKKLKTQTLIKILERPMKLFLASIAITLMVFGPAFSQRPGRSRPEGGFRGGGGGRGPGSAGASTLERAGLKLGQALPDIVIHDAKGGAFRMADLKGKHSVIIFGCLT